MSYWSQTTKSNIKYDLQKPDGGILIVGAGFAGLSMALELSKYHDNVGVVFTDDNSYSKNAGHVIPTMGESLHASIAIKGDKKAMELQTHAFKCAAAIKTLCDGNTETLLDRGYYVIPNDSLEYESLAKSKDIYNTRFEWEYGPYQNNEISIYANRLLWQPSDVQR